jgi:ParB-like chromosome segregation protein Spo0J
VTGNTEPASLFDTLAELDATTTPNNLSTIADQLRALVAPAFTGNIASRVEALNTLRRVLAEFSPFTAEPVDHVEWVPSDVVTANDYNPNAVAPPEMELLRLSIAADGYTQPIVTNQEDDRRVVVDGFHRHRVGKECPDVGGRIHGYLPVVQISATRVDRGDRIASTIRHNRARGQHQVERMSDIVLELKRRNWSDKKIGKELGMDPDEVLRLAQISGLAVAFKDRDFSEAWEAVLSGRDEDDLDVAGEAVEDVAV